MITDVVMPQMGGARLAAELAPERPDMKVLFVSGYAETTVQRHGAIDVTTRFLQKPFSLKNPGPQDPRNSRRGHPAPWPPRRRRSSETLFGLSPLCGRQVSRFD